MKKSFTIVLLSVFFAVYFSLGAFAFNQTLVDDSADLFTDTQETEISDVLQQFTSETEFSIAVITTDFSEGKTSQAYADDYYDNLIISEDWSPNGILFLIDMDNREVCISTAGDCIDIFDYYIDSIIDSGYDYLANGYYSDCILLMIESAYSYTQDSSAYHNEFGNDGYYSEDSFYTYDYEFYDDNEIVSRSSHISTGEIFACFVIALVIAAVSVLVVKSSYKNIGKGDEFDADDVILNLTGSNDTVISRNVITTKIPRNNNNNHRHSSGGGLHRSSGGFSHGGGSRKF